MTKTMTLEEVAQAMVAPGKGVRGDLLNVPIDAPPMRSNALVTCECG